MSTDYTHNILQKLRKSGAAGIEKMKERRPYLDLMVQLFGRRPRNATPSFDSLELKSVVNISISKDKDIKRRYPKPAHSAVNNLLTKAFDGAQKNDEVLLERMIKHEESMNERNLKFLGDVISTSFAGLGDILKASLASNSNSYAPASPVATTYLTQFPPHSTNNATSSHVAQYNMPHYSPVSSNGVALSHTVQYNVPQFSPVSNNGAASNYAAPYNMPQFSPVGAAASHTATSNMDQFSSGRAAASHTTTSTMPQLSPVGATAGHTATSGMPQFSTLRNNNGVAVSNTSSSMHEFSQNYQNFSGWNDGSTRSQLENRKPDEQNPQKKHKRRSC